MSDYHLKLLPLLAASPRPGRHVEAFLTHLTVHRHKTEATQNQAPGVTPLSPEIAQYPNGRCVQEPQPLL
jgi:hypothetical protein